MIHGYNDNNTIVRRMFCADTTLTLNLYKANMTLGFCPYKMEGPMDFRYDRRRFLSTSLDYEKAAALCMMAQPILDGTQTGAIRYDIPCYHETMLSLEYRPDRDKQMRTYLTIDKNRDRISFEFSILPCMVREVENGPMVKKYVQAGLGVFVMTLQAYLTGIGVSRHLNKFTDEELGMPQDQISSW